MNAERQPHIIGTGFRWFVWYALALLIGMSVLWWATADAQTPGTGTLTIATEPVIATPGQVITRLTWSTSPASASCVASGDWSGAKAASGTEALPPAAPPKSYSLRCTWAGDATAVLSWTAPTTYTDGTALAKCAAATDTGTCLAKYRIRRGASATTLTETRDHNFPNATSATWTGLTPGTHWFTVISVLGNGIESSPATPVSKTTSAGSEWTASVGVKQPSPVTALDAQ